MSFILLVVQSAKTLTQTSQNLTQVKAFLPLFHISYSVKQCKVSCLLVPTLALSLWLTPIVDTSKRTPYRCHTEAVLPSILHSESWVRELTVVLSHPSILVVLWRENSSAAVEFPSPISSEAGSAGCPDQTGLQCGAEFCLQTRGGLCIKDSPQGPPHPRSFTLQQPLRR